MVAPQGTVRAMVSATPLVTLYLEIAVFWGGCSTILDAVQPCSHGNSLFGAVSVEVVTLGLLWHRVLSQACSGSGHWIRPAPANVAASDLLPQSSLIHTQSGRTLWFGACFLSGVSLGPALV